MTKQPKGRRSTAKSNKRTKEKFNSRYDKTREGSYGGDKSTHNDISWYTADQQILNDAARIPYSIPTGMPYSRPYENQGTAGTDVSIPGILAQDVMPTLGYSNAPSDPVNVAAQGIYSFVRHLNSGARNYDPVDLMVYIGAMDSVYSCLSWATRLYATICSYAQGNRYLPRILFAAQHVDFDDFANNMVQFRSQLNQRIAKASQLMVPNVMPLFERHRWMFANYYIEGETIKDQIYLYRPLGFYKFQLDSDDAGMLKAIPLRKLGATINLSTLMNFIDSLIDPIVADEDFNIMSGDIYKAYQGHIVTMNLVPDLIAINFTYDENVLLQFKNAKCCDVLLNASNDFESGFFDVTQDTTKSYLVVNNSTAALHYFFEVGNGTSGIIDSSASVVRKGILRMSNKAWSKKVLLTNPHGDVTPAENMVMTRGTMAAEVAFGTSGENDAITMYYGSEWYGKYEVYTYFRVRSTRSISVANMPVSYVNIATVPDGSSGSSLGSIISRSSELVNIISKFKYHPETFVYTVCFANPATLSYDDVDWQSSFFEVDNYSLVDYNVIKGLHDAALLGEYNIPRIALLPT